MPLSASALNGLTQVNTIATHSALNLWAASSNFLVIIILTVSLFLFGRAAGRGPFVALLLSFYTAFAVYAAFPYTNVLPTAPAITAIATRVGLYLALVLFFYIIMRRISVSDFIDVGLTGTLLLAFLASAFLLALAYHTFAVTELYDFNASIAALFAPDSYFFLWFIAPAVGLFVLAR